jgi:hypothetical protein
VEVGNVSAGILYNDRAGDKLIIPGNVEPRRSPAPKAAAFFGRRSFSIDTEKQDGACKQDRSNLETFLLEWSPRGF